MVDSVLGGDEARKLAWALEDFCTGRLTSPPAVTARGAGESGAKAPGTEVGGWGPWMTCTAGVRYSVMRVKLGVLGEREEDGLEATVRSKERLSHWQAQECKGPGRENSWEGIWGSSVSGESRGSAACRKRKAQDRGFAAP